MERREAPGRCATAPLHAPCDRGVYAPHEQVCETRPEARASRGGGLARLAIRTLRLPALHPRRVVGGALLPARDRVMTAITKPARMHGM